MDQASSKKTTGNLKAVIEACGAVLYGHFRLTSGRHSDTYIEKFRVLERPEVLATVCQAIADHFRSAKPNVVAGPSTGGMIVAYEVARQLGLHAIYVETDANGQRLLRRNGKIDPGSRVLLVDDVLTTGLSLREVQPVIAGEGAELIGVGVLIDRSEGELDFGCELYAASRFEAKTYAEDEVPPDLAAVPIKAPGTRASLQVENH